MSQQALEVADIFRAHGSAWRQAHAGRIGPAQLKVMAAIERCRSSELGGHKLRCNNCETIQYAYNSCRNRHCPKCQSSAAYRWLEARRNDLLDVDYYHVVFTVPESIRGIIFQNKSAMYNVLFKAASETLLTIAGDPKHLGAQIGITMVLHTWGSALPFHPHIHCIVPGGGLSADNQRWVDCSPGYLLPVKVLSKLFRRLFLEKLVEAYRGNELTFHAQLAHLSDKKALSDWLKPLRQQNWFVYTKRPFAGPESALTYLSRYTHRVAIANSRLISMDNNKVTFKWKDYRKKGHARYSAMTLSTDEFIRRFLLHVLPKGFHRIRHYGFLANTRRKDNITTIRHCLAVDAPESPVLVDPVSCNDDVLIPSIFICPTCSSPMVVIESFGQNYRSRAPPKMVDHHERA